MESFGVNFAASEILIAALKRRKRGNNMKSDTIFALAIFITFTFFLAYQVDGLIQKAMISWLGASVLMAAAYIYHRENNHEPSH